MDMATFSKLLARKTEALTRDIERAVVGEVIADMLADPSTELTDLARALQEIGRRRLLKGMTIGDLNGGAPAATTRRGPGRPPGRKAGRRKVGKAGRKAGRRVAKKGGRKGARLRSPNKPDMTDAQIQQWATNARKIIAKSEGKRARKGELVKKLRSPAVLKRTNWARAESALMKLSGVSRSGTKPQIFYSVP